MKPVLATTLIGLAVFAAPYSAAACNYDRKAPQAEHAVTTPTFSISAEAANRDAAQPSREEKESYRDAYMRKRDMQK